MQINKDYSDIKALTINDFRESLGSQFFWLESLAEIGFNGSLDDAIQAVKENNFMEEFHESSFVHDYDHEYEKINLQFPTCSYYIRLLTMLLWHSKYVEYLVSKGLISKSKDCLGFFHFCDNVCVKGRYPDCNVVINDKTVDSADKLAQLLVELESEIKQIA